MPKNVLMLSVDDLNDWVTVANSYPGRVHTPNFDALMSRGTTFSNAFSQNAECSPSRTSILTGKTPMQTSVQDNVVDWYEEISLAQTLHAVMKGAGYETVGTGKVYHTPNLSGAVERALFDAYSTDTTGYVGNGFLRQTGVYPASKPPLGDEVNTQYAVNFLNNYSPSAGAPFFLSLGIFRPHKDWSVPKQYYDLYPINRIVLPEVLTDDVNDLPAYAKTLLFQKFHQGVLDDNDWARLVQGYLASISFADAMLGRVLRAIDANGLAGNTTIVLWSDHGFHLGDKETWNKETLWDESTRAPLIIADPDIGRPGTEVDRMVELLDIFPTILDLIGLNARAIAPWLEGQSLRPLIEDPDSAWEDVAFSQRYGAFSVRTPLYRYILYPDGSEELYDMVADPHQWTNLADRPGFATVKAGLAAVLDAYMAEHDVLASSADGDVLVGGGGRDFLIAGHDAILGGGGGDDVYILVDPTATVIERAGGGVDELIPFGDVVLPRHVENAHAPKTKENEPKVYSIDGNGLDNRILGSNGKNLLQGRGGDDLIDGRGNDDTLFGGAGADTLLGGESGKDTLSGDGGNDTLMGETGNDTYLYSGNGTGFDTIFDRAGSDLLLFDGVDAFSLVRQVERDGGDLVLNFRAGGGIAIEQFFLGQAVESLETGGTRYAMNSGFSGPPTSLEAFLGIAPRGGATNGNDVLEGTSRDDVIDALAGDDRVLGRGGDDLLIGSSGDDSLYGGAGADQLQGNAGNDELRGDNGDDRLNGGGGSDTLEGRQGSDVLDGRGGGDTLLGGGGADDLRGGGGHDVLNGGGGDDVLNGHGMDDNMIGGGGADRFRFAGVFGTDRIFDFSRAEGDQLFLARVLGINAFADLDSSGNGRLDAADARIEVAGGDTILTFAGFGELTLLGATGLRSDDVEIF